MTTRAYGTRYPSSGVLVWPSLASARNHAATPGGRRLGAVVVVRVDGGEWTDEAPSPRPASEATTGLGSLARRLVYVGRPIRFTGGRDGGRP